MFEGWDPFEEMDRTYRKLHEMMRRAWEPMRQPWMRFREEAFPVDLEDTDGELILKADLPGFEKDDIALRVTENTVEISAKRKEEKKEVTKTTYVRERRAGAYRRIMNLPVTIDPESVSAEFKNGVLTVRMKKKEVKRGKEIKIR